MNRILIIDDDPQISILLSTVITNLGHFAQCAETARAGMQAIESKSFDLVLLDVGLPDGNGLRILPRIRQGIDPPEVLVLTGQGDPDAAEAAIKQGAWDYLVKPSSIKDISCNIERILAHRQKRRRVLSKGREAFERENIIGSSAGLTHVLEKAARIAGHMSNVLIYGETGTGKELLARAIHRNSARSAAPFVVVDCAALPETLAESILLGHVKGAYTSADRDSEGLIRQAHGGTLFLDEIGELPLGIQQKFLRVIQEHRFRPVGGCKEMVSDFRLIAATHRDLDAMVEKDLFRRDLLFRLRTGFIQIPPLRQRMQDIKELTHHHLKRLGKSYGIEPPTLSDDCLHAMEQYNWPGNIRELMNAVEEALNTAEFEQTLYPHHLPTHIRALITRISVTAVNPLPTATPPTGHSNLNGAQWVTITTFRTRMEQDYLERLLAFTRGNRKEACRISGLSRTRLFELLKKHGLADRNAPLALTRKIMARGNMNYYNNHLVTQPVIH